MNQYQEYQQRVQQIQKQTLEAQMSLCLNEVKNLMIVLKVKMYELESLTEKWEALA